MDKNKKWAVFVLILLIFIGNFIRYSHRSEKRNYADFRVYYATAQRFLSQEDIYARPDESITPYKYSPMFAMMISPLGLFTEKQASLIFFTINFFCVIAVLLLSRRLLEARDLSFKQTSLLYFLTLLFTSRFILLVIDSGQVGLIILLLVVGSLYLLKKGRLLGGSCCLALSIMIKYMPVLFLPYLIIKKKYKFVALTAGFLFLFSILPALYVGINSNVAYLKNWLPFISETSFDSGSWFDIKNQSVYSLFLRVLTEVSGAMSFQLMLLTGGVFAAGIYFIILMPVNNKEKTYMPECAALMLCLALFNPNAWMHNYVVLIFAYVLLIYYHIKTNLRDKTGMVLMILAFAMTSWASESVVGNDLEEFFELYSSITIGTLVLLVSLLRLKYNEILVERY